MNGPAGEPLLPPAATLPSRPVSPGIKRSSRCGVFACTGSQVERPTLYGSPVVVEAVICQPVAGLVLRVSSTTLLNTAWPVGLGLTPVCRLPSAVKLLVALESSEVRRTKVLADSERLK